jgi:hypothetical protein
VDLLPLGIECVAGERHPVLPADQATEAADRRIEHGERGAIAAPPDHALVVRGDKLAVDAEQATVAIDEQH